MQIPGKVSAWSNLVKYPPEFWWLRGRVDGVSRVYKADSSVEGGQVLQEKSMAREIMINE